MARMDLRIAALPVLFVLAVTGCHEPGRDVSPPQKPLAGGSATGNAIAKAPTRESFRTALSTGATDSLVELELARVNSVGYFPEPRPVVQSSPANQQPSIFPDSVPATPPLLQSRWIDNDGDGFGTGAPSGPDANDADPGMHSIAAEGLKQWLAHAGLPTESVVLLTPGIEAFPVDPAPGTVIVYRAGRYWLPSQLPSGSLSGTSSAPILILAWPGETVTFASAGVALSGASNLQIRGIRFDNNRRPVSALRIAQSRNVLVSGCVFVGNGGAGLEVTRSGSVHIKGNLFQANQKGLLVQQPTQAATLDLEGNLFIGNDSGAASIDGAYQSVKLRSNLAHGNGTPSISVSVTDGAFEFANNLLAGIRPPLLHLELGRGNTSIHDNTLLQFPGDSSSASVVRIDGVPTGRQLGITDNLLQSASSPLLSWSRKDAVMSARISGNGFFRKDGIREIWICDDGALPGWPDVAQAAGVRPNTWMPPESQQQE